MNWDPIPNSKYHRSRYRIPTYISQITMMSVQKTMIPEGYLIRLVVLTAVRKYGTCLLELHLCNKNEFWDVLGSTVGTVLHSAGHNLPPRYILRYLEFSKTSTEQTKARRVTVWTPGPPLLTKKILGNRKKSEDGCCTTILNF